MKDLTPSCSADGVADIRLKNKLKKLKVDPRAWVIDRKNEHERSKEELHNKIIEWDMLAEAGLISEPDVEIREYILSGLQSLEKMEREEMKDKSQIKWAIEGDENSRFFSYDFKKEIR